MGNSWNNTKINIELLKATTAQVIKWDSVGLLHSDPVTVSREQQEEVVVVVMQNCTEGNCRWMVTG